MVALGLLLLVVAAVVALVGVVTNLGSSHQIGRTVDLLGYHLHGSTGKLLLVGVIIGAVGMLGLNMLMAGIGRGFKRSISQRKEHRWERRQTKAVVEDRDHLAAELQREHAARVQAEREATVQSADGVPPRATHRRLAGRQHDDAEVVRPDITAGNAGVEQPDATPRA